jgi:hypothetical protein
MSIYTHQNECDLHIPYPNGDSPCEVTVSFHNSRIGEIDYQCNSLYVGNLVDQWGRPDEIRPAPGGYLLRWYDEGIVAQARGSQWFNYRLPVELLIHT